MTSRFKLEPVEIGTIVNREGLKESGIACGIAA
jgi:hypothetical protein